MAKSKEASSKIVEGSGLSRKNAPREIIIDDDTPRDLLFSPFLDNESKGHGLVPRDYAIHPREMFDSPDTLQLIPRSEYSDRIKDMEATSSRISDVLLAQGIPSLNQGSDGYCWGYSTTGCVQVVRASNNQPYVGLSAHMVCSIIKRGVNEGGWCGLSAKFLRDVGVCSQALWPQGSRDYRRLDTPAVRENAGLHKVTEEWVDLTAQLYDQNLVDEVVMTCLFSRIPVAGDFNHWRHSVLLCDPVEVEPGSFGKRLRNSWGDSWGNKGFGILRGQKALTDGAVAIRVAGSSPI
jgi:C1A family cysteine protease